MAHLYLTRTVHMPVTADGLLLKNSFGIILAEVRGTPANAEALAQIINMGFPVARAHDDAYDEAEDRKWKRFSNLTSVGEESDL